MDLSTDFLRTFIAVCECRSFSLATVKVHRSQAAISTQVAKLEEQAGSKFIDRSQRRFTLTKEGELFLTFAQEVVAKTDATEQSLQALQDRVQGEVKIGATRSVGIYVLPDAIGIIATSFPNLKISLLTQGRALTYERLRQHSVDVAIVRCTFCTRHDSFRRSYNHICPRPQRRSEVADRVLLAQTPACRASAALRRRRPATLPGVGT